MNPFTAPARNRRTRPVAHSTHEDIHHGLNHHDMHKTIREERNTLGIPIFFAALIINRFSLWLFGVKGPLPHNGKHFFNSTVNIPQNPSYITPPFLPRIFDPYRDASADKSGVIHPIVDVAYSFRHDRMHTPCLPARLVEIKPTKPCPIRQDFHQAVRKSLCNMFDVQSRCRPPMFAFRFEEGSLKLKQNRPA